MSKLRLPAILVAFLLCTSSAFAQLVDSGREDSPSLIKRRAPSLAKAPPLFQWDKKDRQSPEFRTWLDNEIEWACILYQRTEEYLAAYDRLQDLPAEIMTPKLLAFRAECLLERTPPEVEAAAKLMITAYSRPEIPSYVRYVKARITHAEGEPLKAAEILSHALREGHAFSPWQRERALAVLITAAERRNIVVDRKQLRLSLDDAPPAWLKVAYALAQTDSPRLPVPLMVRLLLAGNGADFNLGEELMVPEARAEILRIKDGPAILAALALRQAQQHEATQPHRALGYYLDLLRLLADHQEASELTAAAIQARFTPPILACVERLSGGKNPERIRKWVTTAVAQIDSAAWWNLRGYAAYHRAAREGTSDRVVNQARLAMEAFDRAVTKGRAAQPPDSLLDIYVANRSGAQIMLGMYATEERKNYLTRAMEDAKEATRLNPNNDSAWSVLGYSLEMLAWRELGIGERESYPQAVDAFQHQVEKGAAAVEAQANLARCLVKRTLDEQGGNEQLAQARQTLQRVLQQVPAHWDANFWLGRILLEQGDLDAAATAFALAMRHPQYGVQNALRIGRLLANRPEEFRGILQRVLADNGEPRHDGHALWLIMRSNWSRRENPRDLLLPQPQAIRDAEEAFQLSTNPIIKQRALEALAAGQRAAAAARRQTAPAERQRYRQAAMATMRRLVQLDPGAPRMWEWEQELAQLLEEDANNASVPGEEQRKLLNEAVGFVQLALVYAPAEQRRELEQFRDDLIRQGANADPKRKLAEPK
jgi:hypothetical protein